MNTLNKLLPDNISDQTDSPYGGVSLLAHWDEFVIHHEREGKSQITLKNVKEALRFAMVNLSILTIEDCNNPTILREALFAEKEKRNWSASTLNTYRKNINTYFKWLLDMDYIEKNNILKIRKCKEVINEQLTLNQEQVNLLRAQVVNRRQTRLERWRNILLIDLLLLTGARPIELTSIHLKDIRNDKGGYSIVIQGKKQKGRKRYYRLPSWLRDEFEMYITVRQQIGREEPYLFISQSKRGGLTYKGINKLFRRLSTELGFSVTPYSIRRFVATFLYNIGTPLKDIQQHLGHTRITTTMRYVERTCALTNRGVAELEKLFK